jgi:hypothetical protein
MTLRTGTDQTVGHSWRKRQGFFSDLPDQVRPLSEPPQSFFGGRIKTVESVNDLIAFDEDGFTTMLPFKALSLPLQRSKLLFQRHLLDLLCGKMQYV